MMWDVGGGMWEVGNRRWEERRWESKGLGGEERWGGEGNE
jgi:hypothetical protein